MLALACGDETTEPAVTDAGVDAGPETGSEVPDAAPPKEADAGADAAPDAPVTKGFCASLAAKPRFCDDFDDADLKNNWDVATIVNGDGDLDPTDATSPPASFAVETAPLGNGQAANVHLRATATGAPTGHVKLTFSVRLATTTFTQGVVAIATLDVSQTHFFTLYLRDGDPTAPAATLEETTASGTTRHLLTKVPPANTWTRATIDLDLGASKASVFWGADEALDAVAITPGPALDPTIRIGAVYVFGPADAVSARFDDVVLDF